MTEESGVSKSSQHGAKWRLVLVISSSLSSWGPIYKMSYNLSQDYRKFIVRSTYDSDIKSANISFRNIVS